MTQIAPQPENLAQLVFLVRGEKVLLDADLAMLYGVETGALNRAVKRNIERFPADFMLQLSPAEWEDLKCQVGISSSPVTNCDYKRPWRASRHSLRLYRARRCHALQRAALPTCG